MNDYNDRCIRKGCSWYQKHLPDDKFVFLTDDAENRRLALEENITTFSGSRINLKTIISIRV